jgi:hypothetical protein
MVYGAGAGKTRRGLGDQMIAGALDLECAGTGVARFSGRAMRGS